ncbi:MAG TPA: FHA domain-containing protein [Pyrinomonadaceae bacterium]|nr:FHA domain-containing protein [Pyrinomonadaceae bacterium]
MITCERCNTRNLEGSQYCDECGALLEGGPPASRPYGGSPSDNGARTRVEMFASTGGEPSAPPEPPRVTPAPAEAAPAQGRAGLAAAAGAYVDGPHAKLVIHRGRSVGKEFLLSEDETHIGRWDADGGIFPDVDLDADDPEAKVSRRHARITGRGGQYYIEDLGSTNGTFINRGRRLLPGDRQPLNDGDEVIVGKTFLRFQVIQ